ncbi:hypothetical protein GCM10009677_24680 [Sphaerisporangium rubeum]
MHLTLPIGPIDHRIFIALVDAITDVRMCRTSGLSVIASITDARRDQLAFARALEVKERSRTTI